MDRALSVLDGVVLVVSAVEGVQPQTRVLWRALRRLRVPTLFFVNKIDRRGAGYQRLLDDIATRLTPAILPMGAVTGLGQSEAAFIPDDEADPATASRRAEVLAEHDDAVLRAYLDASHLDDGAGSRADWLGRKLAGQVRDTSVHPVFFGSAITGAGAATCCTGSPGCCPRPAATPAARSAAACSRSTAGGRRQGRLRPDVLRQPRGPAYQRPAGRHPPGDLRLALRRGTEAGDRGYPGRRRRAARRVPRDHPDLRGTARPHGHGGGDTARAGEPVARHAGVPH